MPNFHCIAYSCAVLLFLLLPVYVELRPAVSQWLMWWILLSIVQLLLSCSWCTSLIPLIAYHWMSRMAHWPKLLSRSGISPAHDDPWMRKHCIKKASLIYTCGGLVMLLGVCNYRIYCKKKFSSSPNLHSVHSVFVPSVLWHCWLGDRKGIWCVIIWVLIYWWWWFDWSFVHVKSSSCHHCRFHHLLLQQNPGRFAILMPAFPGSSGTGS